MKLGHSADEIKYIETVGTVARYLVVLEDEPVMSILCDSADSEKVIRIASGVVDAETLSCNLTDTAGRFTMLTEFTEDKDGMPLGVSERVNEKSVYTYVIPRLHILLARLLRAA